MKAPPVVWTKDLKDTDSKTDFVTALTSSLALRRLKVIVAEDIAALEKVMLTPHDYDSPSWAYKQANLNGRLFELRRVQTDLLGFIED